MRVVMLGPEALPVPPIKGGAVETWIYETAKRMAKECEVYVISPRWTLKPFEVRENCNYIHLKYSQKKFLYPLRLLSKLIPSVYAFPYNLAGSILAKTLSSDIIHVHDRPQSLHLIRCLNKKSRLVLQMHAEIKSNVSTIYAVSTDLLEKADAVIAVSKFIKKNILDTFPWLGGRVFTVYGGVDVDLFRPRPRENLIDIMNRYGVQNEDRIVIFVGRLVPQKGAHLLVKAFSLIKDKIDNAKLLIIGKPESTKLYVEELKRKAGKNVIFTGWVEQSELPLLYSAADVFVCPSIWDEPFGLVCLEAQASGLPVVGSKRGGIPEAIEEGETGVIVEPKPRQLADALIDLLLNDDMRKQMSEKARQHAVLNFSWDKTTQNTLRIYKRVTDAK